MRTHETDWTEEPTTTDLDARPLLALSDADLEPIDAATAEVLIALKSAPRALSILVSL